MEYRETESLNNKEESVVGSREGSVGTRRCMSGAVQGAVAKSSAPEGATEKGPPPKPPSDSESDSREPFLGDKKEGLLQREGGGTNQVGGGESSTG